MGIFEVYPKRIPIADIRQDGAPTREMVYWMESVERALTDSIMGLSPAPPGVLIYGDGANWVTLAPSALATRYLSNRGPGNLPAWSQIKLDDGVEKRLPVGNGGFAWLDNSDSFEDVQSSAMTLAPAGRPPADLFISRSVVMSSTPSGTFPDPGPATGDPNMLAYRNDTLRFGVNAPNGNTQYPLEVYGAPVDIGYLCRMLPTGTGSAYVQMLCVGANDSAGFAFNQNTNGVEWRMAVIGNDGNAMRWTSISGGGALTTHVMFVVPDSGNIILDTARNDVTTGTKCFVIGIGTAPTAVAANTVALYADDDVTGELFVINEAGEITQISGNIRVPAGRYFFTNDPTFMLRGVQSYTNGAGASLGTLTNAPSAGNPTKWVAIDDNGTTRHVPAW